MLLRRSLEHPKLYILEKNLHPVLKMGHLKTRKKTAKTFSEVPLVEFL